MSFQSQGERVSRATSRLVGAAEVAALPVLLRLVLLLGFAAVAWLLAGYLSDSVAQAAPVAEDKADGDAEAARVNPLEHWLLHPEQLTLDLEKTPLSVPQPVPVLKLEPLTPSEPQTANPVGDEVVVVSHTPPPAIQPGRMPNPLDAFVNPLAERVEPLATLVDSVFTPVAEKMSSDVEQVLTGLPLTPSASPVGQQKPVAWTPPSDTKYQFSAREAGNEKLSQALKAPDLDTAVLFESFAPSPHQGLPLPGGLDGGLGSVSGNSGSGLATPFSGSAVTTAEYVAPTMNDHRGVSAFEVASVNPDVLEDPTFSPD